MGAPDLLWLEGRGFSFVLGPVNALGHKLCVGGRKSVEASHQRVLQRGRHVECWQWSRQLIAVAHVSEPAGLQYGFGQLFKEERHTLCLRQDLGLEHFGQALRSPSPIGLPLSNSPNRAEDRGTQQTGRCLLAAVVKHRFPAGIPKALQNRGVQLCQPQGQPPPIRTDHPAFGPGAVHPGDKSPIPICRYRIR